MFKNEAGYEMRCHTAIRHVSGNVSQIETNFLLIWLFGVLLSTLIAHFIFWNEQKWASDLWKLEMYDLCKKLFIFKSSYVYRTLYWM